MPPDTNARCIRIATAAHEGPSHCIGIRRACLWLMKAWKHCNPSQKAEPEAGAKLR